MLEELEKQRQAEIEKRNAKEVGTNIIYQGGGEGLEIIYNKVKN